MTKTTMTSTIEYAAPSLLRRCAAMIYDTLLLVAISIFYGAIMTAINVAIKGIPETGERVSWGIFGIVVFIGWIFTVGLFFCYFWHKSGQTLGMKTWRMKVMNSEDLQLPSYSRCIIRCLCAPISLCLLGAGYWFMYTNAERQTLHDKLSKTRTLLVAKELTK